MTNRKTGSRKEGLQKENNNKIRDRSAAGRTRRRKEVSLEERAVYLRPGLVNRKKEKYKKR